MKLKSLLVIFFLLFLFTYLPPSVSASTSTLYFLHSNHQGSIVAVTDERGKVVSQESFYPYGESQITNNREPASPAGGQITERGYTGQIRDDSSNLMYYNARYYNSTLGIFNQPDPVGGINKYAYAAGNPVRFTDPSGNMVADPGDGGGCYDDPENCNASEEDIELAQKRFDIILGKTNGSIITKKDLRFLSAGYETLEKYPHIYKNNSSRGQPMQVIFSRNEGWIGSAAGYYRTGDIYEISPRYSISSPSYPLEVIEDFYRKSGSTEFFNYDAIMNNEGYNYIQLQKERWWPETHIHEIAHLYEGARPGLLNEFVEAAKQDGWCIECNNSNHGRNVSLYAEANPIEAFAELVRVYFSEEGLDERRSLIFNSPNVLNFLRTRVLSDPSDFLSNGIRER